MDPQSIMLVGAVVLAIALTDHLLQLILKDGMALSRKRRVRALIMENLSIIILFLFVSLLC